ncbi:TonB-dependent receptor [Paludibacterium paludis]|uniref:TonB-dependent receptor n=2 Tax=Paludibacterium paludis TaxID=1225769 RepID=A0A918P123_9NEIS|nr:TonB-dependent receptor [Paludibacterium paludis]
MMRHTLAAALTAVFASGALADGAKTSELGTITIIGEGDKLGSGLLQQEDSGRARSNVSRSSLEKERPTSNPYQVINMLPGVNAVSTDASGLFGGSLNLRGFNADQIGFTVNGMPVNDSGNFAVYPQEFLDNENLCQTFVTQGSTDTDAPHIGATGGNVGFSTCDPEDKSRVRVMQTYGSNRLSKTFARFDTGRVLGDAAKFYVSFSHAEADKWKGLGSARRDHVDAGFRLDLGSGSYLNGSLLWNNAVNHNFYTPSLKELQNDYFVDYATTFPGHLTPVKGTAQDESTVATKPQFYKLSQNPFRNLIASVNGVFKLSDKATLKVSPYFWYGFGTGGTQQQTLKESGAILANGAKSGKVDLNGDGDTLDTIIVANSSVTRTLRPGLTVSLNYQLDKHALNGGIWMERATHRQTGPAVPVNSDGTATDIWLQSPQITRPDGSLYQSRDWKTITTAVQPFFQDTMSFLDDKLSVTAGARYAHVKRDFNNYANEGSGAASMLDYQVSKSYNQFLPSLSARYFVTPAHQVFGSVVKNFRAPPNFAYTATNGNVAVVNGKVAVVNEVKPETSVNFELGYRYQSDLVNLSATLFRNNYKDRHLTWKDQLSNSYFINAGDGVNQGVELEAGTAPFHGVSAYVSYTHNDSKASSDLDTRAGTLPIKDKKFPMTPDNMFGLTLQYAQGPFYVRGKMKYTGKQQATLMNDESVPGYTTFDLDVGYQLPNTAFFKNPMVRASVTNLTSKRYWTPSSPGINAQKVGNFTGSTLYYLVGQPRAVSVTVSSDF